MEPVLTIRATMAPLPRADVDTDQIMPKQFLKRVERTGYGEFLFHDWRRTPDGQLDPNFVLNKPEYQNAGVLVTGRNFGGGSSREHAPWGLQDWGFRAIVAPSFADIFKTNCTKIGLLPVELSPKEVIWLTELAQHRPDAEIVIDLIDQEVTAEAFLATFEIDSFVKHRLLHGLDDIEMTLQHVDEITEFESRRPGYMPVLR
ncbi:MAG: 3-isopropylmalate dehydratase small subunit [Acidimicrobiia bacterium]|nr:3-isopropylmalate dehydratase small subunit [Acidimicrobiia bacterium]